MTDLIPLKTDDRFPVNARDLHAFLGVKMPFSTWASAHCLGNTDGEDFIRFTEESTGGRPRYEYRVTINLAKHISMQSRTDRGEQARQWFIDRESKLAQVEQTAIDPANLSRLDILKMAIDSEEQRVALAKENQVLTPKAEAFDHFIAKDDAYNIEQAANLLGIGPRDLWDVMKDAGHIYRRNTYGKSAQWIPAQRLKRANYLTYKETPFTNEDGQTFHGTKVFITGRGVEWYRKNLRKFGLIEAPQLKAVN